MPLERGFWRLIIVLSGAFLIAGNVLDVMFIVPHTTVRVTLTDGRQVTLGVQWVGDYPTNREALAREISTPSRAVGVRDISEVKVLHGPDYWWWSDSVG